MKKTLIINELEIEIDLISLNKESVSFDYLGQRHNFSLQGSSELYHKLKDHTDRCYIVSSPQKGIFLSPSGTFCQTQHRRHHQATTQDITGELLAALPGRVIGVLKKINDPVHAGEAIFIIEAMKLEHRICATMDGQLTELNASVGDSVEENFLLGLIV